MNEDQHKEAMTYIRDLGAMLLRSLDRTSEILLKDKTFQEVRYTNELLEKLLKMEQKDDSTDIKEVTKAVKDLNKTQLDTAKQVITAIKQAKPTIPPFPSIKFPTIDFKGVIDVSKSILSVIKESPAKIINAIKGIGTKENPVYVVQIDEKGNVVTQKEAQTIVRGGGVVRTVTLANKAGIEFNPATEETLQAVLSAVGGSTAPTTFGNGQKNTVTAGTRVQLSSSSVPAKSITLKAKTGNTGTIYVGDSAVSSSNGFELTSGDTLSIDIDNLNDVWIVSTVNAEGVSFVYVV